MCARHSQIKLLPGPPPRRPPSQVSELSHKLGSAQGAAKSLEAEVEGLRAAAKAAAEQRHDLEMRLGEARAKLAALEEKVGAGLGRRRAGGARGSAVARARFC
jgi:hypothetical protein